MADVPILDHPTNERLLAQLDVLLEPSDPPLTLLANMASLLYWSLPDINWMGFYLSDGEFLRLGPFHGKPACTVIPIGHGVCGTAAQQRRTLNVPDVEAFPGHIACDAASRSELVIPLLLGDRLWGVLDADSPLEARFDAAAQDLLELAAGLLLSRMGNRAIFPA
jgi:GAF domain-containing protein